MKKWIGHHSPDFNPTESLCGVLENTCLTPKVPKSTVASIIIKWKKFGTTKTLPRDGQTEQLGEKGLGKRVDQEPDGHSGWAPEILYGDGKNFKKDNNHWSIPPLWALWQSGQTEATHQWKSHESLLEEKRT